jgi:hypothetical protein
LSSTNAAELSLEGCDIRVNGWIHVKQFRQHLNLICEEKDLLVPYRG